MRLYERESWRALIPPGTQTTIEATIDTTRFQGRKDSGLVLVIDRPTIVEVELNLTCFIRSDVNLTPGQIDFGTVRRSEKLPTATLTLTYSGGRPGWEIAEMKTQTAKVKAVAERTSGACSGLVQWTVSATLQPSITNGYFKDEITLITNDSPPQMIPISVIALVQSAVVGHPVDHQFRSDSGGSVGHQDCACSFLEPVFDHPVGRRSVRAQGRRADPRLSARPYCSPDNQCSDDARAILWCVHGRK